MTRFYLQTQAPAGNWTDHLGAEQQTCIDHGQYLIDEQHYAANQVRVVERVDTVVWVPESTEVRRCTNERGASARHPLFEGYVNGKLVVFHQRQWIVRAVVDAIAAGRIPATGDAVVTFSRWAETNAPEVYARIVRTSADGLK